MKKFLACLLVLLMSVTAVASAAALPIPKGNTGKQSTRNQSRTTEAPTAEPVITEAPTAESTALPTAEPTAEPAAEPTSAPAADDTAFSFRNGVRWGMTPDEVAAAEGREADSSEEQSAAYSLSFFSDVSVSRYTAEIGYVFCGGALQAAVYGEFESDHPESDFSYLSAALSSIYGQPETADEDEIYSLTDHFASRPEIAVLDPLKWSMEDGTAVYMFFDSVDFYIMYINAAFFETGAAYDVTGL